MYTPTKDVSQTAMSFINKVVIVTGASSGIGAETAVLLAKEGADVAIVARTQAKLDAVAKQIQGYGKKALVIRADLSKEEDAAIVVPRTVEHFGKLDVLINNAGVSLDASILEGNVLQAYDSVMNTNVRSIIQLTTAAAPHLIKTKGNIINISSILAVSVDGNINMLAYKLSKAALDHFTRCAALELAPSGVRVNNVNPGPVDNDFIANNNIPTVEVNAELRKGLVALDYIATNQDVGELILFVASGKARSITGSTYFIDNGYLLKH